MPATDAESLKPLTAKLWPWHESLWNEVSGQYNRDHLHHAYLLTGPKGLGQLDFAYYFSQLLLCEQPIREPKLAPCFKCLACHQFKVGTHPEYHAILPESQQIKISQIREVCSTSMTSNARGKYRVLLLAPADAMNAAASNALLKYLEEPRSNTIFILLTEHLSQLLPTVVSRCLHVSFKPVSSDSFHTFYQTGSFNMAEDQLYRLTAGAPLQSMAVVEPKRQQMRINLVEQFVALLSQQTIRQPLTYAPFTLIELVSLLQTVIVDLLKIKFGEARSILNLDCHALLAPCGERVSYPQLLGLLKTLACYKKLLFSQVNLNETLFIESVILSLGGQVSSNLLRVA